MVIFIAVKASKKIGCEEAFYSPDAEPRKWRSQVIPGKENNLGTRNYIIMVCQTYPLPTASEGSANEISDGDGALRSRSEGSTLPGKLPGKPRKASGLYCQLRLERHYRNAEFLENPKVQRVYKS